MRDFNMNRKRVIIFGAGSGAKNLTKEIVEFNDPYEILAYADNDPKLQGTLLFEKPIIHPDEIKTLDFEQIIVASLAYRSIIKQLTEDYNIPRDLINITRFTNSYQAIARVTALKNVSRMIYDRKIEGDVAELGVFQGNFAKHINYAFPDRTFYMFDTFEGFSDADIAKDMELGTKGIIERSFFIRDNFSDTSIEMVLSKMENPENCIIRKGLFPETAIDINSIFSYVSIDVDLYNPILEGLKYFYPRMASGGVIFVDDYFNDDFTGAKKATLDYCNENNIRFAPIGDNSSIAIVKSPLPKSCRTD